MGFYSGYICVCVLSQTGNTLVKRISCLSPWIGLYFMFWSHIGAPELDFKMKLGWKMHSRNVPKAPQLQIDFQSVGAG